MSLQTMEPKARGLCAAMDPWKLALRVEHLTGGLPCQGLVCKPGPKGWFEATDFEGSLKRHRFGGLSKEPPILRVMSLASLSEGLDLSLKGGGASSVLHEHLKSEFCKCR